METVLIIIAILLIVLVLLQSNKASGGAQIISGGNADLFQNQKERGSELLITRITGVLSALFIIISFILYIK
ncbi:MAG: preprotein translocase subunit SecG [Bacilli bacterium]|nr:preprotein translocase subunit SecG [Bacilli bacterium]